jgi:indolepyruvate decarboxylase
MRGRRATITIGEYLIARLRELGVGHVFGVPGDFILPFYDQIVATDLDLVLVPTCNELNAGYAADGYARLRGLGAVAVTYGVGAFSTVNAIAGAYAEDVPVVLISGAPTVASYQARTPRHHVVEGNYRAALQIFAPITVAARALLDPGAAPAEIDAILALALARSKPVYLEIPTDVQLARCATPRAPIVVAPPVADPAALRESLAETVERLKRARTRAAVLGFGIHRAGLEGTVRRFIERANLPVASLLAGKADYLEGSAQCIGPYLGAGCPPTVRRTIEDAEVLLSLGSVHSDFNLGAFTATLDERRIVHATRDEVRIGSHIYPNVPLPDFVRGLARVAGTLRRRGPLPPKQFPHSAREPYLPRPRARLSNKRFYDRIAHFLRAGDIVLADAGCSINALYVEMPRGVRYVSQSYWAAIGYAFGAALGAGFAKPRRGRVIALEGDGSFQMTAQELSSMVRYGQPAIVFVVNNKGYTAERLIHEGPYNDIPPWRYHALPEVYGGRPGMQVRSEGDLEAALAAADRHRGPGPLLIEVHLDPYDASEAFKLMSAALRASP